MLAAPASLACKEAAQLRTQATQVQPEQPAFPAQWFYGLYVISSVRRAVWPPSPLAKPPARNLIPASGDRDRTISPSARMLSSAHDALSTLTSTASRFLRP